MSTNEIAKREVALAPADFPAEKIELLKRTICKGSTNDELELFMHACRRTGLDPFMKQIHAVKRWQDGREVMTIQTGIDGYRLIADRTSRYMPGREPSYAYNDRNELVTATAHVKKLAADGTWHEVSATAHFDEYCGRKRDGGLNKMWAEKPHIMLAKCAEALALRRAFPAELSGVYTREEMEQADNGYVPPAPQPPPANGDYIEPEPPPTDPEPSDVEQAFVERGLPTSTPDDDEKFVINVREAFEARDFKPEQLSAAVAHVCMKKKIHLITKLSATDRKAFLETIAAGRFDRFKEPKKAKQPEAATA